MTLSYKISSEWKCRDSRVDREEMVSESPGSIISINSETGNMPDSVQEDILQSSSVCPVIIQFVR